MTRRGITHALLNRTSSRGSLLQESQYYGFVRHQCNTGLPEKLFRCSLDGLQVCQVELQKECFLSSAVLELANGGLTLSLVTAGNVDFRIFREEDLRIDASMRSK
jgi:hypothetical protein